MVVFYNESGSIEYSTDGILGKLWSDQLYKRTLPNAHNKYNHHMGWPEDYNNIPEYWNDTKRIASELGIVLPDSPDQTALNSAHAIFANSRDFANKDKWLELNVAIHWHEHHLQNRGPVTTLDFNHTGWIGNPFPVGVVSEPEVNGGLYLLYTRIGRWWDELWRANDISIPAHHHRNQVTWNASCYMVHYDTVQDPIKELAIWNSRTDWGCKFEDRQQGRYRVGRRTSDVPKDWNLYPVCGYRIT